MEVCIHMQSFPIHSNGKEHSIQIIEGAYKCKSTKFTHWCTLTSLNRDDSIWAQPEVNEYCTSRFLLTALEIWVSSFYSLISWPNSPYIYIYWHKDESLTDSQFTLYDQFFLLSVLVLNHFLSTNTSQWDRDIVFLLTDAPLSSDLLNCYLWSCFSEEIHISQCVISAFSTGFFVCFIPSQDVYILYREKNGTKQQVWWKAFHFISINSTNQYNKILLYVINILVSTKTNTRNWC